MTALAADAALLDAAERGGRVGHEAAIESDHPASSASAARSPRARSRCRRSTTNPNSVSLASRMTSSSVSKTIGATGPKISSRRIGASAATGRARSAGRSSPGRFGAAPPVDPRRPPGRASTSSATLSRRRVDQRAQLDRRSSRPTRARPSAGQRPANSSATALHVDPVGGRAGLSTVSHLGDDGALHGGVEVGVVEHDERRVAAELHRAVTTARRACSSNTRPTSVEPVKDSLRTRGSASIADRPGRA